MKRRDLLRGSLLLGGGVMLAGLPLADALNSNDTQRATRIVLIERSLAGERFASALRSAWPGDQPLAVWRLNGPWLEPDRLATRLGNHAGLQLCSLLSAANHGLLLEALRLRSAGLVHEQRVASATQAALALAGVLGGHADWPMPSPAPTGIPLHTLYATL